MIHSNDMSRYEDFKKKAIADYIDHDRFIRVRDMVLERMERRHFFDAKGVYHTSSSPAKVNDMGKYFPCGLSTSPFAGMEK